MADITPKFNILSSAEMPGGILNSTSSENVPVVPSGTMVQPIDPTKELGDTSTAPNVIQQGYGNDIFKVTSLGLHLGAASFSLAPFRVDMQGNLTATSATITGSITATTGAIGGFSIGADYIRDAANSMGMASTISGSDDVRFWAGAAFASRDTAPFRVYESGLVVATNAVITVASLGGFDIGSDYIRDAANTFGLASTVTGSNDVRIWAGDTFTNRGSAELRIYEDGSIIGTNATFTGALFATSGWIGSATALVYESQGINTGTTGFIRGGQTSYNTGTGYFLGYDTGAYRLSIGNTANYLTWDGTELQVAGTFNIGGTTITIDNTDDIQTRLNEIETAGGGVLYLRAGTYTLTDSIFIPGGVKLEGVSRDAVIIDCDGSYDVNIVGTNSYSTGTVAINNGDTTVVGSGTTWTAGMVGRYILLDGLWYEITARTDNTHITIDTYQGDNLSGAAYTLADVNFTGAISKVTITGATGAGLIVQRAMEPTIFDVVIYGCGTGIDMDYVVFPIIQVTSNENGVNLDMNFVEGFYIDFSEFNFSTTGAGIVMTSSRNATVFNSSANDNTGNGVSITGGSKIAMLSLDVSGNGGNGMEFISGNQDNQMTDVVFDGNTGDGIKLTATSDRTSICQTSITNNGGYGINIAASTCDNNNINSPSFGTGADANTSGNINDSGTGTIILPNTPSFIADEDLTVGQPVGISNYVSGKVARAFRRSSDVTLSFTAQQELSCINRLCTIGGDKFAFALSQVSDDSLYVTIGSIATGTKTVTLGTSLAATADISPDRFAICKLNTDKFIVFYVEDASTTIIKYRVGTVSGTTITYGSAATFTTAGTAVAEISCDYLSTDKGVMTYKCSTATDARAIAFTVSSTTATAGTPIALSTNIDDNDSVVIRKVGTDKFMIVSPGLTYVQIGTCVGGTTITLGTAVQFSATAQGGYGPLDVISPATDVAVITYLVSGSNVDMIACTISGTTPTFGTALTSIAGNGNVGIYAESATSYLVYDSSVTQGVIKNVTRSGTTLTNVGTVIQGIVNNGTKMLSIESGYWTVIAANSTSFGLMIQGMSNQYFGFAESTVSRGDSVGVITSGKIGGLSGLSPGGLYLVTSTGLTFSAWNATMNTADDVYVRASSTTEVVL